MKKKKIIRRQIQRHTDEEEQAKIRKEGNTCLKAGCEIKTINTDGWDWE